MYNHGTGTGVGGSGLLSLPLPQGENSTTPRTPEILNSLIAMTNPFDSQYRAHAPRLASSPPGGSDTSTSSSGSPGCMSPPSVQHTCSQLIKEGLKLTLQSKRRQGCSGTADDPFKNPRSDEVCPLGEDDDPFSPGDGLTPEDEERRRRRRERNKIAATKCRLKKRERTVNLVQESEILENQNHDLKTQIQELETQRRRLVEMLNVHGPSCTKLSDTFSPANVAASYPSSGYQSYPRNGGFRRVNTFPRASTSSTLTYRRVELTSVSCSETYQSQVPEDTYPSSAVYHNFDNKDSSVYCRSGVASVESPPSYGDQYPCQTVTNDQFVKPELPSMGSFHSPSPSYVHNRLPSLDMASSVSPGYDTVNSPNLVSSASYRHYDEESDTFSSGFSPTSLDGSCMSAT